MAKEKTTSAKYEVDTDTFKTNKKFNVEPLFYLLPFIIGVAIFTLWPILNIVKYSFINGLKNPLGKQLADYCTFFLTNAGGKKDCTLSWGIENFTQVLTDKYFISALKNTAQYVIFVVPISTVLAIVSAVLLNQKIKARGIFQTVFFLPMVTSSIGVGICWKYLFN